MTESLATVWRVVRFALVVGVVVAGGLTWQFTPWGRSAAAAWVARVAEFRESAWAPIVFIAAYAMGCLFGIPGTIFGVTGGTLFGMPWAFVYNTIAGNLGASAAFCMSRVLGRDFVRRRLGRHTPAIESQIEQSGFTAVLALRLVGFPFNVLNSAAGLVSIRWRTFAWATLLGMLPGTFLISYLADGLHRGVTRRETAVGLALRGLLLGVLAAGQYAYTRRARRIASRSAHDA